MAFEKARVSRGE